MILKVQQGKKGEGCTGKGKIGNFKMEVGKGGERRERVGGDIKSRRKENRKREDED
jgi:hypothetical protein